MFNKNNLTIDFHFTLLKVYNLKQNTSMVTW